VANIKIGSEAEWLSVRESHIGGSEIASLFYLYSVDGKELVYHLFQEVPDGAVCLGCLSPYKTGYRLWLEKAAQIKPDSFGDNERVIAGQFMESAMAEWAKHKYDLKLRKVRRYMTHADVRGWGASLDYELIEAGMAPVEFKNVDRSIFAKDWMADGDEVILPPLHINLQLQTQIGVTAADYGLIIACVGGNELKMGRVARHEPTQIKIAEAISAFWAAVDKGVAPAHLADFETVAKLYSIGSTGLPIADITQAETACKRYRKWKKHLDFVEEQVSRVKAQIASELGAATKGKAGQYVVTWPAIHIDEKTVPSKVQAERNYRGAFIVKEIS
jgi:predicted phage-related endonuclease